jgi:CRP/FNR family transcriptional regulator, polysaccharide utilization system transcription regulator
MEHFDSSKLSIDVKEIRFLSHCTSEELLEIQQNMTCASYKKGQTIFNDGSTPQGVFYVRKGVLKLVRTNNEGKEQILRFAKEGDLIGYRALIANEPFVATAVCIDDVVACFIPKPIFSGLLDKNFAVTKDILQSISHELGVVEERVQSLAQKSVRERLAETLLFLHDTFNYNDKDDAVIHITLPREDIANIVGTATETIIRLLSEFKHDKLVELEGKKIKIVNPTKLHKISTTSV